MRFNSFELYYISRVRDLLIALNCTRYISNATFRRSRASLAARQVFIVDYSPCKKERRDSACASRDSTASSPTRSGGVPKRGRSHYAIYFAGKHGEHAHVSRYRAVEGLGMSCKCC